ncbi:MmcQ/YjbR family DNA-binding protein [Blastococcus sp. TF02-09]|uniref:MmcQ/YjbR family DNA-binding protein n=1 Tax=Blastococcus sp. TF02-09 TaxID=2250576 RepID=UPI000DEBA3CA|nr:MmcQ/YjbR family DNA-binding protein [Blastococcus sp. TF02-9]RBY77017.1 MmcQ/YjbR family DNA-binding protein [Blastococcus sp. TF02-9]
MATWDDVARTCLALPDTTEVTSRGSRQWKVADKLFVWERPLGRKDLAELGVTSQEWPVVAARVPDEGAKAALIAEEPELYFTTSHFDGYAAVLCRLDRLDQEDLTELAADAWACRAPRRLLARGPLPPAG